MSSADTTTTTTGENPPDNNNDTTVQGASTEPPINKRDDQTSSSVVSTEDENKKSKASSRVEEEAAIEDKNNDTTFPQEQDDKETSKEIISPPEDDKETTDAAPNNDDDDKAKEKVSTDATGDNKKHKAEMPLPPRPIKRTRTAYFIFMDDKRPKVQAEVRFSYLSIVSEPRGIGFVWFVVLYIYLRFYFFLLCFSLHTASRRRCRDRRPHYGSTVERHAD
jgi:hypothetical protein